MKKKLSGKMIAIFSFGTVLPLLGFVYIRGLFDNFWYNAITYGLFIGWALIWTNYLIKNYKT